MPDRVDFLRGGYSRVDLNSERFKSCYWARNKVRTVSTATKVVYSLGFMFPRFNILFRKGQCYIERDQRITSFKRSHWSSSGIQPDEKTKFLLRQFVANQCTTLFIPPVQYYQYKSRRKEKKLHVHQTHFPCLFFFPHQICPFNSQIREVFGCRASTVGKNYKILGISNRNHQGWGEKKIFSFIWRNF